MNERIKKIRLDFGMNQFEFANELCFTTSMISQMENGIAKITDRTINAICSKFHINRDWLLTGEGNMYIENDSNLSYTLINEMAKNQSLCETARIASPHMRKEDWSKLYNFMKGM